jgi:thiazole synthase
MSDLLKIANKTFHSRLFLGTGKYSNNQTMQASIKASGSEMVTVALKRVQIQAGQNDEMIHHILDKNITLLPNTSGVRTAKEAVFAAQLAREALETNWLKLEIHPDPKYLMPDPIETLLATEMLAKEGFIILPYIHADPVLCQRLYDAGASAVMPLGSPIGSNKGIRTKDFLSIIIEQSKLPVVIDAGIGAPSDAAFAMELGADAVLVNTAIATAYDPIKMSEAFKQAVIAGRTAYISGLAGRNTTAVATSPMLNFLD